MTSIYGHAYALSAMLEVAYHCASSRGSYTACPGGFLSLAYISSLPSGCISDAYFFLLIWWQPSWKGRACWFHNASAKAAEWLAVFSYLLIYWVCIWQIHAATSPFALVSSLVFAVTEALGQRYFPCSLHRSSEMDHFSMPCKIGLLMEWGTPSVGSKISCLQTCGSRPYLLLTENKNITHFLFKIDMLINHKWSRTADLDNEAFLLRSAPCPPCPYLLAIG